MWTIDVDVPFFAKSVGMDFTFPPVFLMKEKWRTIMMMRYQPLLP
jgi:hypothetical protein